MKQRIAFVVIFVFGLATNLSVSGQTRRWEESVIEDFAVYIESINKIVSPHLNADERKVLKGVSVVIDTIGTYTANSNSETRTITFSRHLIKCLVRFFAAQVIEFNPTFNRKGFAGFYTGYFPFLDPDISPEQAAELTGMEVQMLDEFFYSSSFKDLITTKIMFLYLHELRHQFQDYSHLVKGIELDCKVQQCPPKKVDSLKLLLEFDADNFVTKHYINAGVDPQTCLNMFSFVTLIKENKYSTVNDINSRIMNFLAYCSESLGCRTITSQTCNELTSAIQQYQMVSSYFTNRTRVVSSEAQGNIESLYQIGDAYLTGSNVLLKNIDSALYYYELGASLDIDGSSLYGTQNQQILAASVEYCLLMAGKISECYLKDANKAIQFFKNARAISMYFDIEFYDRIIARLEAGKR